MTRVVYMASPLSGDIESNLAYARDCLWDSLIRGEAPFAPHLIYTQVLNDENEDERKQGMDAGNAFLRRCDALVAYVDKGWSRGMLEEKRLAQELGIAVEERRIWEAL